MVRCVRVSQISAFSFCFLLFFRNDGGLNFFFFLDGDLEGDPSGVPPCGLVGGTGGRVEVSLVVRAFIPFSSSSVVCFSSSPPFCIAGETVFGSSAQKNKKTSEFSSFSEKLEWGGLTKVDNTADEHACVMRHWLSVYTY